MAGQTRPGPAPGLFYVGTNYRPVAPVVNACKLNSLYRARGRPPDAISPATVTSFSIFESLETRAAESAGRVAFGQRFSGWTHGSN